MRNRIVALGFVLAFPFAPAAIGQVVPDSIVAEGIPDIPEELARSLNRYQNIRTASFQDWVADRREMLILTRFADTNQVHQVAMPGGARTQLTFFPERVLGASARPNHAQFVFSMDEGGAENYQIFLDDPRTGDVVRLTDGASRNTGPRWSNSGDLLAWSSNARNGRDLDLYVSSATDPKLVRRFHEVEGTWTVADWSPDNRRVAAVEYISINESYVHLIELATGNVETVTPRSKDRDAPKVSYGNVRWAKDGKSLYWTTDRDSEFQRLARYNLESGESTTLTEEIPWDIEEFDVSDDGEWIAVVANVDGISTIYLLRNQLGSEPATFQDLRGQISGLTYRSGSHEFAFTMSSATSPSDVYSFSIPDLALTRWTQSETGGLDPDSFAVPELIHYKTFDDREIPAFVYRPGTAKFPGPRPVIINIHGGPEGQFRPGFLGRTNYLINELGIVLIFPNVRGSSGYGKSYLTLDNGMNREGAVKDIGALLDWIAQQPGLDAKRVGVTGGSYGGFMSLATQTNYNDRIKAGIDIVGISNFVTFLKSTQSYRRDLRRAEYGDERDPETRAFLERVSPLTNADKIKTPILVVQGQNDPRVPRTEAEQVVEKVRKNGGPVWYVLGKNEGHGFAKKANQDYLQAVEILFWKRFLLDETD